MSGAIASLLLSACSRPEPPVHVEVRNPEYLVVRTITRAPDAEHAIPVELPYAEVRQGFASNAELLDLRSCEPGGATFAGGRTSVVGEATIWLPLTAEGSRRLEAWSSRPERADQYLGIFLRGRLIAAPRVTSRLSGGLPLRVAGKSEGDRVLRELRRGGIAESD
jgi:hypothetical protein